MDLRDYLERQLLRRVEKRELVGLQPDPSRRNRYKVGDGVFGYSSTCIDEGNGEAEVTTVADVDCVNRFLTDDIDWSGCKVYLVASVPGRHKKQSIETTTTTKTGKEKKGKEITGPGSFYKFGFPRLEHLIKRSQESVPITPTVRV